MTAIKTYAKKYMLFLGSDFDKLCVYCFLNETTLNYNQMTNSKTGYAIPVDDKKTKLDEQAISWFFKNAEIYLNLRSGKKNKGLIFYFKSKPWFFANRKRFGVLCAQVVRHKSVQVINRDTLLKYAEELQTDEETGELHKQDITDWTINEYHEQWEANNDAALENETDTSDVEPIVDDTPRHGEKSTASNKSNDDKTAKTAA